MIGVLQKSVEVNGKTYPLNTDFRVILRILVAMDDPELMEWEKIAIFFRLLYGKNINPDKELWEKGWDFISKKGNKTSVKLMDWEQDEELIFSAVNTKIGKEVREMEYLHWWTFLSYYGGIGECPYTQILSIRDKRARGKKLEKWEQEYYSQNKNLIDIHARRSSEEQRLLDELNKRLG